MAGHDHGQLQVLFLILAFSCLHSKFNFRKFYVGRILTELEAAKIYDKLAIFYHGIQAKTNFKYTKADIINLVSEPVPNVEIH